mgnify:CR=1 FL=1
MPKGEKNSVRWKNGCPESTRKKMSESAKKRHEREKNGKNEDSRRIL